MNDILLFTLSPDKILFSEICIDLTTGEKTELRARKPFVFVCPARAYFAHLYNNFFEDRHIELYVNIDRSEKNPVISIYLYVQIEPPVIIDERSRYFLHGIATTENFCLPSNGQASKVIYGSTFEAMPEKVIEIEKSFKKSNQFVVLIGCQDPSSPQVLLPEGNQAAKADHYYEMTTKEFLRYVFSLPVP